jgi:hypothetical protein
VELADAGCDGRFPVVDPEVDADLSFMYLYPMRSGWRDGDREVLCLLTQDGAPLTEKLG